MKKSLEKKIEEQQREAINFIKKLEGDCESKINEYPKVKVSFSMTRNLIIVETTTVVSKRLFDVLTKPSKRLIPVKNFECRRTRVDVDYDGEEFYLSRLAISMPANHNNLEEIMELAKFAHTVHEIVLETISIEIRLQNIEKDMEHLLDVAHDSEETNQPDPSESDIKAQPIGF